MKVFKYTDSIQNLIELGYQKTFLYASNFVAYKKNRIILYEISDLIVEIENVAYKHQSIIIQFILDNKNQPPEFWERQCLHPAIKNSTVPAWSLINGKIYNQSMKDIEYKQTKDMEFFLTTGTLLRKDIVSDIIDLQNHILKIKI